MMMNNEERYIPRDDIHLQHIEPYVSKVVSRVGSHTDGPARFSISISPDIYINKVMGVSVEVRIDDILYEMVIDSGWYDGDISGGYEFISVQRVVDVVDGDTLGAFAPQYRYFKLSVINGDDDVHSSS